MLSLSYPTAKTSRTRTSGFDALNAARELMAIPGIGYQDACDQDTPVAKCQLDAGGIGGRCSTERTLHWRDRALPCIANCQRAGMPRQSFSGRTRRTVEAAAEGETSARPKSDVPMSAHHLILDVSYSLSTSQTQQNTTFATDTDAGYVTLLRNSQPAVARVTKPIAAIGQYCDARDARLASSRNTPRTMTRK